MKTVTIPLGIVSAYALVRGGQAILIDTGLPGNEKQIIEALNNEGVSLSGVRLIVVTHAHPDHSGSAERLRRVTGAPVGIHKDDASFAQTGTNAPVVPATFLGRLMAPVTASINRKTSPNFEPDVVFDQTTPLDSYGFTARVIHTPGHTAGSVSLVADNGDAFISDIVARQFMIAGKVSFPIFAVDKAQVIESLRLILAERPSRCFSAHAGEVKVGEIKRLVERY